MYLRILLLVITGRTFLEVGASGDFARNLSNFPFFNDLAANPSSNTVNVQNLQVPNVLITAPVGGPNVCRARNYRNYCCPGWTQKSASRLCVIPICTRPCGAGRCVKPNLCLCDGGKIAPVCPDSSGREGGHHHQLPAPLIGGDNFPGGGNGGAGGPPSSSSCQITCLNGGTCIRNKCICRSGYKGEFCSEPVCREPCLNAGRCIGADRCACVYGYTGRRCEADYRTGPCFTRVTGNTCGSQLHGVVCTRNLCCATVGKAWGHPCEICPSQLDCEPGHLKNVQTGHCIDVDECEAIPGICEFGCKNTPGSYYCECPPGQITGPSGSCEKEDVCLKDGGPRCANGRCVPSDSGGYHCICNRGFISSQDRKMCIDARQGNCFTSILGGICRGKLSVRLTKRDCCCGMNMGKGWGDENNCEMCPSKNTNAFRELCVEPGLLKHDECGLRPDICGPHGTCIDQEDGYKCQCDPGFSQRSTMGICLDIDECQADLCQGGRCVNVPGSHTCICPIGYDASSDGKRCLDHDECTSTGMCANGKCINMDGSFKCQCNPGYILSATGHACLDMDECYENPRICLGNSKCINTPGSYKCQCLDGWVASEDNTFCIDLDECKKTAMCGENGRCFNMDGSYKCVCNPGYRLDPTTGHCVDINECQSQSPPCQGRCHNLPGSFRCDCLPGFILGADGRTCLDTQLDLCYAQYGNGLCTGPSALPLSRSSCCCASSRQQMGWGNPCKPCPSQGSPEFDVLCPHGAGMTHTGEDLNECLNPNICVNGACENLLGSYRCICDPGYISDWSEKVCTQNNECEMDDQLCLGGTCRDTIGSFECICPTGTEYDTKTQSCIDVNECIQLGEEACKNGRCINTLQGFICECNDGFILDNSGQFCIDNRKGSCWKKISSGGKCEGNIKKQMLQSECCCSGIGKAWGSPCERCNISLCAECQPGFAPIDGKKCENVNECELNPGICGGPGAICIDNEGSYTCRCPPGLDLSPDGTRCLDERQDQCFLQHKHGTCSKPLDGVYLRSDCCCTVGKAWGKECLNCPREGSEAFAQLCPRGRGSSGRKDSNECTMIPNLCENGRCRNTIGSYTCRCNQGFALDEDGIKCIDLDECNLLGPGVCGNGSTACKNLPGGFECTCLPGFQSTMLMQPCMDRNECQEDLSLCRGGYCQNTIGSYECQCPPGLELSEDKNSCKDVDECSTTSSGICSHGRCENLVGNFICVCDEGYQQIGNNKAHCEDINECLIGNGGCDQICINTPGSYSCSCPHGSMLLMDGKTCTVDECLDSRICNGGKCSNVEGSYKCTCENGLLPSPDGSTCLDLDECQRNPGICGPGICQNSLGGYNCLCDEGFSVDPVLELSCFDDDECELGNFICDTNAECVNTEGSYDCKCKDGWIGDGSSCRDINECQVGNGGCHKDAQCINVDGSFRCACDPGFEGDGVTCKDTDECADANGSNLCENGVCLNHPGGFRCECDMGFFNPDDDDHLCVDINECEMFQYLCVFGRCENIHGMFRCHCNPGFQIDATGGNCTDINECEFERNCAYGTCINTLGSYTCQCPPNYELVGGNSCVDKRKGQCFLDMGNDLRHRQHSFNYGESRDCGHPIGDSMTRASCCCSVGSAWGPLCQSCPKPGSDEYNVLCPGGQGFRPNGDTVVLEDFDECQELGHICHSGRCTNTFGESFMCTCNFGYRLDASKSMCIDINECLENPGICGNAFGTQCVNDDGGYHCICPEDYMTLPNGRECVDMRKEPCYMEFNNTSLRCSHPMAGRQTKMVCCCSMGAAWGDGCFPCPTPNSVEHTSLCGLRPGQIVNPITGLPESIQECSLMPGMCGNGLCVDTDSGFTCDCFRGFIYDETLHTCIDENECDIRNPCEGNSKCVNLPGRFECTCPSGYRLDFNQRGCIDENECERQDICQFGECKNLQGSFQCKCKPGFVLTASRDSCIDRNECEESPTRCSHGGTCVNTLGSWKCLCKDGFKLTPNGDCEDINECKMIFGCRHGRCKNTLGSFICQCADGYVLTQDGQNCRDLDECQNPANCPKPGICTNLMGSYTCSCPSGYELSPNGSRCIDFNECSQSGNNLCIGGICINKEPGFECQCYENSVLSPDGKRCVDTRQDYCYDGYGRGGTCSASRRGHVSKTTCCCTGGKAWGSNCEACPKPGSRELQNLCPGGIGRGLDGEDLDECSILIDACSDGECVNTDGSYRCSCSEGFLLDASGKNCIDLNECLMTPNICRYNGTCVNVEGSFECTCPRGYISGPNQICEDADECSDKTHHCAHRCHNRPGGYYCSCPPGYELGPDRKSCVDIDECKGSSNCKYACKNLIGSFMCICPPGYTQVGQDDCRDINECLEGNKCLNGTCINILGGFKCRCENGFEPSPDYTKCIDRRTGFCFRHLKNGQCSLRDVNSLARATKAECCCSLGVAWGAHCELCPRIGSPEHKEICFETGYDVDGNDINECSVLSGLCTHGSCINTLGSYRCICQKGYKVDSSGTVCLDINECENSQNVCQHGCENTQGSYLCLCEKGYTLSSDGVTCKDIDECASGRHGCSQECINTQGSYICACVKGYTLHQDQCLDNNECNETGVCVGAINCINTLGSYKCICPRGFKPDENGVCRDEDGCSPGDDRCKQGGCQDGFIPHHYYDECVEQDECSSSPNRCQCPPNFQYDHNLSICVPLSSNCIGSPCAFGCTPYGSNEGFICGCPNGYRQIGNGHCLSTITPPAYGGYDLEDGLTEGSDRFASTEGCFSCKVGATGGGRGRRSVYTNGSKIVNDDKSKGLLSSIKQHTEISDQLILMVPLNKATPRYRILSLQTSIKKMEMFYSIVKGNEENLLGISRDSADSSLRFRRRMKVPRTLDIELRGYSLDPKLYRQSKRNPFTLRIRLIITN